MEEDETTLERGFRSFGGKGRGRGGDGVGVCVWEFLRYGKVASAGTVVGRHGASYPGGGRDSKLSISNVMKRKRKR